MLACCLGDGQEENLQEGIYLKEQGDRRKLPASHQLEFSSELRTTSTVQDVALYPNLQLKAPGNPK